MPAYQYAIEELSVRVAAAIEAEATTLGHTIIAPHFFGLKYLETLDDAPKYVWAPTRTKQVTPTILREVDLPAAIAADLEQFEIFCWGRSFAQTWALRQNVRRAVIRMVGPANVRSEGGEWRRPGAAFTQRGELFVVELSLALPLFDALIDLAALTYADESTAEITKVEGDVRSGTQTSSESYVTTTTEDP